MKFRNLLIIAILSIAPNVVGDLNAMSGKVILLNGTGSAGKSSIGRALASTLPSTIFISEEEVLLQAFNEILKDFELPTVSSFNKAVEYLNTNDKLLSDDVKNDQIKKRLDEIDCDDMTYKLINQSISQEKNVVVDNPMWEQKDLDAWKQKTKNLSVTHVVVYCSLDKLLEHIEARNKLNDPCEQRAIALPFKLFKKLYTTTSEQENLHIDTLDQTSVIETLKKAKLLAKTAPGKESDKRKFNKDFVEAFLQAFKLTNQKTTNIKPFFEYDIMVNSGTNSPEECAQQIIDRFSKLS